MIVRLDLRALAKINIDLRILHKRPDGYHELRTIFQTISLADRISVAYEAAEDTRISIDGDAVIEDNLIARAARLVVDELRCGGYFRFGLRKSIPMGAGLGGGSSDAAAVLLALPGLMGRSIEPARLQELAASLGSDVPFFLHGGTAVGLGRGEELYPLPDLPAMPGLLVTPAIHVSTAEAYGALSPRVDAREAGRKRAEFAQVAWAEDVKRARNDFEGPVFERHPELADIREKLARSGAVCARMTGSGSSLFGLFPDEESVRIAQAALLDYRTFSFAMVSRKEYRELWNGCPCAARTDV